MTPFIVLIVSASVFLLAGRLGAPPFRSQVVCVRLALALMLLLTASAHFTSQRVDLIAMVPPYFPAPELLVTLTGIAELAAAVGLLIPRTARLAAGGLALLLLAMFPANVYAARATLEIGGTPVTPLLPRTLMQVVFIAAALYAGFGRPKGPAASDASRRDGREATDRLHGNGSAKQ